MTASLLATNRAMQAALRQGGFYHGEIDGKIGPVTKQACADWLLATETLPKPKTKPQEPTAREIEHHVTASSFADPADVAAYKRAKAKGMTDQQAFRYGDNAIGCWGDDTSEGSGPSCAIPPEDMAERWGSVAKAKHKPVLVTANGKSVRCVLKDRMPKRSNIRNGAGIDLNPDAVTAIGLRPPIKIPAVWQWA